MPKKVVKRSASRTAKSTRQNTTRAAGARKKKGDKPAKGAASPASKQTSKENARADDQPAKESGNAAVGRMNDALSAAYADIKDLLFAAETGDVEARYNLACQFEKIRAGDGKGKTYGVGAVQKLANALGMSKSTINDYANVVKAWPKKSKFGSLINKCDKFEKALTWSHYIVIATAEDEAQREQLLAAALKNGWSVRDLKSGGQAANSADDKPATPEPAPSRTLAVATGHFLTQLKTVTQNAKVFSQQVSERLHSSSAEELTDDLLEKLRQARRDLEELYKSACDEIDKDIELVEQRRNSVENQ